MTYTKATFEMTAEILRDVRNDLGDTYYGDQDINDANRGDGIEANHNLIVSEVLSDIAKRFADQFARSNGRFDRDRFIRACERKD